MFNNKKTLQMIILILLASINQVASLTDLEKLDECVNKMEELCMIKKEKIIVPMFDCGIGGFLKYRKQPVYDKEHSMFECNKLIGRMIGICSPSNGQNSSTIIIPDYIHPYFETTFKNLSYSEDIVTPYNFCKDKDPYNQCLDEMEPFIEKGDDYLRYAFFDINIQLTKENTFEREYLLYISNNIKENNTEHAFGFCGRIFTT